MIATVVIVAVVLFFFVRWLLSGPLRKTVISWTLVHFDYYDGPIGPRYLEATLEKRAEDGTVLERISLESEFGIIWINTETGEDHYNIKLLRRKVNLAKLGSDVRIKEEG